MCGKYFISELFDLTDYRKVLNRKYDQLVLDLVTKGDILPSSLCLVRDESFNLDLMKWQYEIFNRKVINSRCESINNYYSDDYLNHKCLILASGFYEFDENKKPHTIQTEDAICYLAGLYQIKDGKKYFSIITKQATSTKHIHERVPVVFNKRQALQYLNSKQDISILLKNNPSFIIK